MLLARSKLGAQAGLTKPFGSEESEEGAYDKRRAPTAEPGR